MHVPHCIPEVPVSYERTFISPLVCLLPVVVLLLLLHSLSRWDSLIHLPSSSKSVFNRASQGFSNSRGKPAITAHIYDERVGWVDHSVSFTPCLPLIIGHGTTCHTHCHQRTQSFASACLTLHLAHCIAYDWRYILKSTALLLNATTNKVAFIPVMCQSLL